jgi:hypothetical protein
MMHGRHGHRSCVYPASQFLGDRKCFTSELPGYRLRPGLICINHGNQFYSHSLMLEFVIDASMVLAESADTYDRYLDWTLVLQSLILSEAIEYRQV